MKICIDCTPEELHELLDEQKCKTVAGNSEITNSIRDAVYQAMMKEANHKEPRIFIDGKEIARELDERKSGKQDLFTPRK